MTVIELMRKLQRFDKDLEIMFWSNENGSGYAYEHKEGARILEEEICRDIDDEMIYVKSEDYDEYVTLQDDLLAIKGTEMGIEEFYDMVDEKWEKENWKKVLMISLYN